jgi:hypothetical protein
MAYSSGKKALYEVFGKTRPKTSYERLMERLHLGKRVSPRELFAPPKNTKTDDTIRWPKRPRVMQFNAGRIEISVPYQLAIAGLLSIILVMLVFFRLGQISYKQQVTAKPAVKVTTSLEPIIKIVPAKVTPKPVKAVPKAEVTQPVVAPPVTISGGSNRIVIQSWSDRAQLEPVVAYFTGYGIKTEIRKIGNEYYLVTSDKYENPQREGTDGYKIRQKIVELGAKYQAPPGYASFGSQPFHDAYGMKFDN